MEPVIHHVILGLEPGADPELVRHHRLALKSLARARGGGNAEQAVVQTVFVTESGFDYSEWDLQIVSAKRDARQVYGDAIRPLPLASEVFGCLAQSSADVVVLSNADICFQPHFYDFVSSVYRARISSWTAHRRTIPGDPPDGGDILQWAYSEPGVDHPGSDLFVTTPQVASRMRLGDAAMGMPGIGDLILLNLALEDPWFARFSRAHLSFHFGDDRPWLHDRRSILYSQHRSNLRRATKAIQTDRGTRALVRAWRSSGQAPSSVRRLLPYCILD